MMDELQIEERPIGIYGLDDLEGSDERLVYLLQLTDLRGNVTIGSVAPAISTDSS